MDFRKYSEENCEKVQHIFDDLIDQLILLGETAPTNQKITLFKIAVEALNE
ncbi:MAG: hypothetical protein ACTHLE_26735 [Agriterribacter sp.]